jgi:RHS repeat-associated protein
VATLNNYGWEASNTDRLGSVRAARRYPFGEGNNADNDEFATYRKDTTAQHYYAWHRFYSATWGRFSSPDTYQNGARLTTPQSWNAYSYVENDPLNSTDPTGLTRLTAEYCQWFGWQDWECGNSDLSRFAESGQTPRAGGWNPCPAGPGFLPNPMCSIVVMPSLPVLPPKEGEPKKPECFAQLKYRPVNDWRVGSFASHAFWWVQDRHGQSYIVSGGPERRLDQGPEYLHVWVQDKHAGPDKPSATTAWASGLSSLLCNAIDVLLSSAVGFPKWTIQYRPILGPNSNSAARFLGNAAGFNVSSPPGAIGWDAEILVPSISMP